MRRGLLRGRARAAPSSPCPARSTGCGPCARSTRRSAGATGRRRAAARRARRHRPGPALRRRAAVARVGRSAGPRRRGPRRAGRRRAASPTSSAAAASPRRVRRGRAPSRLGRARGRHRRPSRAAGPRRASSSPASTVSPPPSPPTPTRSAPPASATATGASSSAGAERAGDRPMPEGDTIHRTAARLRPALAGRAARPVRGAAARPAPWPAPGTVVDGVEAAGQAPAHALRRRLDPPDPHAHDRQLAPLPARRAVAEAGAPGPGPRRGRRPGRGPTTAEPPPTTGLGGGLLQRTGRRAGAGRPHRPPRSRPVHRRRRPRRGACA